VSHTYVSYEAALVKILLLIQVEEPDGCFSLSKGQSTTVRLMEVNLMRALRIIGCAGALAVLDASGAQAQGSNERLKVTYLTFSAPVEVPGASLPAGKYLFKMADTLGSSHAVQIFSADGKKIYTTFLAIPNQMTEAPDKTVVLFDERPAGAPQAVKVWYYPGNSTGEEFVYPRKQAIKIAKANHTPVLSSPDGSSPNSNTKVARVDETGRVAGEDANQAAAADNQNQAAPAANQVARAQEPAAPSVNTPRTPVVGTAGQTATPRRRATTLPRTASNLSLFALLGGLSLLAALGLRRVRLSAPRGMSSR